MAHICTRCEEPREDDEFYRYPNGRRRKWCNGCERAYQREYRAKNLERVRANGIAAKNRMRQQCLEHYGGTPPRCACCGEGTPEFLALDHIDGNGRRHRAEVGHGSQLYYWIVREGFPPMFQILCHNCNSARQFYGVCPHQR